MANVPIVDLDDACGIVFCCPANPHSFLLYTAEEYNDTHNHLDAEVRELLRDALVSFSGVGLLVSHDRTLLDGLCHQCLFIEPPNVTLRLAGITQGLQHAAQKDRGAAQRLRQLRSRVEQLQRREQQLIVTKKYELGIWLPGSYSRRNTLLTLAAGSLPLGQDRQLHFPQLVIRPRDRITRSDEHGAAG